MDSRHSKSKKLSENSVSHKLSSRSAQGSRLKGKQNESRTKGLESADSDYELEFENSVDSQQPVIPLINQFRGRRSRNFIN